MKKKDVLELQIGINNVRDLSGVKFAYCISKNANLIKNEVEAIQDALNKDPIFLEFDAKRLDLAKECALKDKDGNPVSANNNYIMANQSKFDEEFLKLKEEYKEMLDSRDSLLEEDVEVKLFQTEMENVPADITSGQFRGISLLIKE